MIVKMNPHLLCCPNAEVYRLGQFLSMVIAYAWFISSVYSVYSKYCNTLRFGVAVHLHDGVPEDM